MLGYMKGRLKKKNKMKELQKTIQFNFLYSYFIYSSYFLYINSDRVLRSTAFSGIYISQDEVSKRWFMEPQSQPDAVFPESLQSIPKQYDHLEWSSLNSLSE